MIKVGKKLDDNILEKQFDAFSNGEFEKVKIKDYKGKWLVLVFYPADFSFICPTEMIALALAYNKIKSLGVELMSVSTDSVRTHKAWHESSSDLSTIKFPMLADPEGELSEHFGVYIGDEGICLRGVLIIDPDSVLRIFQVNDNKVGRSVGEIIRLIQASIYTYEHPDELCPVDWKPGFDTIHIPKQ